MMATHTSNVINLGQVSIQNLLDIRTLLQAFCEEPLSLSPRELGSVLSLPSS